MTSEHYYYDRQERERLIETIGIGEIVDTFIIDKGHKNGPERHVLTSTGIIIIYNAYTDKLVTKLIARMGQIKRYYENGKAPKELISVAKRNQEMGYNYY